MDKSDTLKKIQKFEKEALKEFSNFCKTNKINFFLRGGSVLGAVKYNDMVPWDDDIDIAFPRDDYEKLMELCPVNFSDNFLFICYRTTENAHCYFPRIILKDNIRIQNKLPKNNERGLVLIDILPLDGMPDNKFVLKLHIYKAYFYRLLASVWTYDVKDTVSMHSSKKQKIITLLYKLKIHHLYKQDTIYRKMDKLYSKYKYGYNKNAGMIASSKLSKEIMEYRIWGEGINLKFGDSSYLVPINYDEYLKKTFGKNYKEYEPSLEERTKSHIIYRKDNEIND